MHGVLNKVHQQPACDQHGRRQACLLQRDMPVPCELQALMAGLDGLMREFMAEITPGGELPPSTATNGEANKCTIFPGLLTDPAMTTHVIQSLDEAYSQDLHAPCDIDERDFLTHEAEPAHMHPPQHMTAASVLPSLSRCHVSTPTRARYARPSIALQCVLSVQASVQQHASGRPHVSASMHRRLVLAGLHASIMPGRSCILPNRLYLSRCAWNHCKRMVNHIHAHSSRSGAAASSE